MAEAKRLQRRIDELIDLARRAEHEGKRNCATCEHGDPGGCVIDRWLDVAYSGDGRLVKSDCPGWKDDEEGP